MNRKIKKIVGVIFIILGLGIIITVLYRKIETNNKQKELQRIFQEVINVEESTETIAKDEIKNINGYIPVALIEIPSINLSQGIVKGVTDDILKYYLGHFESSVMPGEKGNFAVAGHRVSDYSEAFINLYKVKQGDKVLVKYNNNEYVYEIEEKFVVNPWQVDVLENTQDEIITLVTCTVGAKERLIVKGKLVEVIN